MTHKDKMFKSPVLLLVLPMLALGACGIKPNAVDAPSAAGGSFPHTYPDPATDPGKERPPE